MHQLIGVEGILICLNNGVLQSDQGKFGTKVFFFFFFFFVLYKCFKIVVFLSQWEPFPIRGLTNKTVVAIATSPFKEGSPFVYIAAVCFTRPTPTTRHWFVVIFAFWLQSPSTSTAVQTSEN